MTLSNVVGVPYISRVMQRAAGREEAFVQFRHAEQETFKLRKGLSPIDPLWKRLGSVARASAAIPLVFPTVQLSRRADEPLHYIMRPAFEGEREFWYYDGDTFNNLPISLAWHYAQEIDGDDDPENRIVVVINPWRPSTDVPDLTLQPNPLQQAAAFFLALRT